MYASLIFRKQTLLRLARIVGWGGWPKQSSPELDQTVEDACTYINEQQQRLQEMTMRRDLLSIEVQFLEDEMTWMKAVLDAAGVKLKDYDHLRRKKDV